MIQVQIELEVSQVDGSDMRQMVTILERDDATDIEREWAEKIQSVHEKITLKAMMDAGMTVKTTKLDVPESSRRKKSSEDDNG